MMHYKVVCSECNTVIAQCSCIACNKEVRVVICDNCIEKQEIWKRREGDGAKIQSK